MAKELYFNGYGYFKVNADNKDEALEKLEEAFEKAGIEFYPAESETELRDN